MNPLDKFIGFCLIGLMISVFAAYGIFLLVDGILEYTKASFQ